MKATMKNGDIIKIYYDPLTKKDFEGEAKLIKKLPFNGDNELWQVKFINDGFVCDRFVNI